MKIRRSVQESARSSLPVIRPGTWLCTSSQRVRSFYVSETPLLIPSISNTPSGPWRMRKTPIWPSTAGCGCLIWRRGVPCMCMRSTCPPEYRLDQEGERHVRMGTDDPLGNRLGSELEIVQPLVEASRGVELIVGSLFDN